MTEHLDTPSETAVGAPVDPAWSFRDMASRQNALPDQLRQLHRAVLHVFLDTGSPPSTKWIEGQAERLGLDAAAALDRLAAHDLVHTAAGVVDIAYPFSGTPTPHRVRLGTGPDLTACCAIDALGIPQMVNQDGIVVSADAVTGDPVRVKTTPAGWHWDPAETVVLVARTGGCGPSSCCTCPHINFHTAPEHAQAYLAAHPDLTGQILDQPTAVELARLVFGPLLARNRQDEEHG